MGQINNPAPSFTATSETAAVLVNDEALDISGLGVVRIAPAAPVTGIIVPPGSFAGQRLTVMNEGPGTAEMAAAGTSNVASGAACIVQPDTAKALTWNAALSLWYAED